MNGHEDRPGTAGRPGGGPERRARPEEEPREAATARPEDVRTEDALSEGARSEGARSEGAGPEGVGPEDVRTETDAKVAELEDRWLRAVADLDNLRKRFSRDAERLRAEEQDRVAAEWLPVLDNLELALSHAAGDEEGGAAPIMDGIRAVRDQAVAVLARLGYTRHDETGVPFDPAHHDAMATIARPDVEPGTVVQVVRPGYGDGRRQLRPAVVVVAKKAD
ncbi:nucleotide exchange factor GrpE [Nonomuraea cavernae]|uniref:Protein GrpE n=1 Tax=Nonomuraea cavernae TaxID=2045107 RepID=A0A917YWG0_9ACTN|nr:nucleotide exchange factor GrpE [Nonomuraea cavernae]MCA2187291.1 nucleotide exchange factor GrpE [Nonomuraea cavernae]GGO68166.1 protein GrpE [Nonomuraea cavernae]